MSVRTGIEWTDATWNPTTGCTRVSAGCDHCYAASLASGRLAKVPAYEGLAERGQFNGTVRLLPDRLDQPLRWAKPRMIFVNSMSDLFHDQVPDDFIAQVFAVMASAGSHTFQILTKRHNRMRLLLSRPEFREDVESKFLDLLHTGRARFQIVPQHNWPLPNVWLGVSVENQQWADIRIPALLGTPAAVRFISAEPLIGALDLAAYLDVEDVHRYGVGESCSALDWVIAGGESGRGARPMHPAWARSIRDQCHAAGVPFLFKQWGEWAPSRGRCGEQVLMWPDGFTRQVSPHRPRTPAGWTNVERPGKKIAGRELDGRTWDEYPVLA